jgi:hypothetical protein
LLTGCNDAALAAGAVMIPTAAASEQPSALRVRRFAEAPACFPEPGKNSERVEE